MAPLLAYVFCDCPDSSQMEMTRHSQPENARLPHLDNLDRPVHAGRTDCDVNERDHTTLGISRIIFCRFWTSLLSAKPRGWHYRTKKQQSGVV
jgi:hypothetical protein